MPGTGRAFPIMDWTGNIDRYQQNMAKLFNEDGTMKNDTTEVESCIKYKPLDPCNKCFCRLVGFEGERCEPVIMRGSFGCQAFIKKSCEAKE